jgi:hypothetical protein
MSQVWDKNLPSASRFTILAEFNNEAVRDNNTGLVWERTPSSGGTWAQATLQCLQKEIGGTTGWRLPSIVELNSVRDPTLPAPYVPASVFPNFPQHEYWSATTLADDPTQAWFIAFLGFPGIFGTNAKTGPNTLLAWAVRGPMNADKY